MSHNSLLLKMAVFPVTRSPGYRVTGLQAPGYWVTTATLPGYRPGYQVTGDKLQGCNM